MPRRSTIVVEAAEELAHSAAAAAAPFEGAPVEVAVTGRLLSADNELARRFVSALSAALPASDVQPIVGILVPFTPILITAALYCAGLDNWTAGAGVYLVNNIFIFYLVRRSLAIVLMASIAAQYGLLLALEPNMEAPFAQWVFFVTLLASTGIILGGFVERTEHLAESETLSRQQFEELSHSLEDRVAEQVGELERLGGLRRFLATPVADAILNASDESLLAPHRREIAVLFCDLRGFTEFAATSQPEDVHGVLTEYFETLGESVRKFEATVGAFTGDGMMAFFNDPLPCPDPAVRAIKMAIELQAHVGEHVDRWRRTGVDIGFGVGVALGYADIGMIGFEGRRDYTALGSVVNLASRLCSEARPGEILVDQHAHAAAEHAIDATEHAEYEIKGFHRPVLAYSVS